MVCWRLLLLGEVDVLLSRLLLLLLDGEVLAGGNWRLLVVTSWCLLLLLLHNLLQVRLALVLDILLLASHSNRLGHDCLCILDTAAGEHWSH